MTKTIDRTDGHPQDIVLTFDTGSTITKNSSLPKMFSFNRILSYHNYLLPNRPDRNEGRTIPPGLLFLVRRLDASRRISVSFSPTIWQALDLDWIDNSAHSQRNESLTKPAPVILYLHHAVSIMSFRDGLRLTQFISGAVGSSKQGSLLLLSTLLFSDRWLFMATPRTKLKTKLFSASAPCKQRLRASSK